MNQQIEHNPDHVHHLEYLLLLLLSTISASIDADLIRLSSLSRLSDAFQGTSMDGTYYAIISTVHNDSQFYEPQIGTRRGYN